MQADHQREKDSEQQAAIRLARQLRANGKTLRGIAVELNHRLIPTKNRGLKQAAAVKKILDRATAPPPVKTAGVS